MRDNVEVIGPNPPVLNQCMKDKNVQTFIREIVLNNHELRAVKYKQPETWHWIDVNTRNCFYEGIGAGTFKC